MITCHLPLFVCLLGLASANYGNNNGSQPVWNPNNCPRSTSQVTDIICCRDEVCAKFNNEGACNAENKCMWSAGEKGKSECRLNRDRRNNVCCAKDNVNDFCSDLSQGKCPRHFQVRESCCSEAGKRYTGVLQVEPGKVCCNTPCTDTRKLCADQVPQACIDNPQLRSLGGPVPPYNRYDPGFNTHYLPQLPKYGHVAPYTGMENSYYELPGKGQSSVGEVQEITVDDLFHALVEALSNDKDVFTYSSEIYSDPYFGKAKYGGSQGAFNLPDPNIFMKQIYGNQYGLSQGQFGFQGVGWPGVQGVLPGSGYGSVSSGYHGYSPYQSYGSYEGGQYPSYGSQYPSYSSPSSYGNYQSPGYGSNQYQGYGSNQYQGSGYNQYQQGSGYSQSPGGYSNQYNPSQSYQSPEYNQNYNSDQGYGQSNSNPGYGGASSY